MKIDQSNIYLKHHSSLYYMSNYWTDYLGNGENVINVTIFLFHKIENKHVINHCDALETSTFTKNWCWRCLRKGSETGEECAIRGGSWTHAWLSLWTLQRWKKGLLVSSIHKRRDLLQEMSFHAAMHTDGLWVLLNFEYFDFRIAKLSKIKWFIRRKEFNTTPTTFIVYLIFAIL